MSIENNFRKHIFDKGFSSLEDLRSTSIQGWRELVMKGYGFPWSEEYADFQTTTEYLYDPRSKIVALSINNLVIASLVLNKSKIFSDFGGFGIHGIVVLPEYRGLGLANILYKEIAKIPEVKLISGNSKTPQAVMARASGCSQFGMRTFYGLHEVTPGMVGKKNIHKRFVNLVLDSKHPDEVFDYRNVVFLKDTNILLPDIPNLEAVPEYLKTAFAPIVLAQEKIGKTKTAVSLLISIKDNLLNG